MSAQRKPRILAFAGSARQESYNKKMVAVAAIAAREAGADVTLIDLRDYPMPIYDGDFETHEGLPENAKKLKRLFLDHDGLLISCPEYNSSISPLLKNTIDWVSRPAPDESQPLAPYADKVAVLMSASPGALGGLRGLVTVRSILGNIKVTVLPDQFALSKAHEAFDENGKLRDENQEKMVRGLGEKLAGFLAKLVK